VSFGEFLRLSEFEVKVGVNGAWRSHLHREYSAEAIGCGGMEKARN